MPFLGFDELKNVAADGVVHEDVIDQVFDISDTEMPFTAAIGTNGSIKSHDTSWVEDELPAPNTANAKMSDYVVAASGADNNATVANEVRVYNYSQISTKVVEVEDRTMNIEAIGRSDEFAYQTGRRLTDLRRDLEAISTGRQASRRQAKPATTGLSAGFSAYLKTNTSNGAGGANGGYNSGTKLITAPTAGTLRVLSLTIVKNLVESTFIKGGNTSIFMSVPELTRRFGEFLFTTPFAATPTANVSGQGTPVNQVSQGYIDVFKTDFGFTMNIVPNRHQQKYQSAGGSAGDACDVYGIDPRYAEIATMAGFVVQPLAKQGLQVRRLLSSDWLLRVTIERAHWVARDINHSGTVVA